MLLKKKNSRIVLFGEVFLEKLEIIVINLQYQKIVE